jgi:VWFA-related protein
MRRSVWARTFSLVAVASVLGAVDPIRAQEPPEPEPPPPEVLTFPSEVEVILVDAVVTDAQDQPVKGLSADDFSIQEDGVTQTLTRFEAIDLPEGPTAGASPPAPAPTPRLSTNDDGPTDPSQRSFVVVMDDLNLGLDGTVAAHQAARQFLEAGTRPGDLVNLIAPGAGLSWAARVPEGSARLIAALGSVKGQRSVASEEMTEWEALRITQTSDPMTFETVRLRLDGANRLPRIPQLLPIMTLEEKEAYDEQNRQLQRPIVEAESRRLLDASRDRKRRLFDAVSAALDGLSSVSGRKSVLLFSEGFTHERDEKAFRDLVTASRRRNAPIYFVDVRRLTAGFAADSRQQGGLSMATRPIDLEESTGAAVAAEETGGFSLRNPNNLEEGVSRISREASSYYLLGYSSTNPDADGEYRRLEVEVRRPGLNVRARKGYYAPSAETPERRPGKQPGEDPELKVALASPAPLGQIPLRLGVFTLEPVEKDRVRVVLAGEVGLGPLGFEADGDQSLVATMDVGIELNHVDPAGHWLLPWREWKVRVGAQEQGANVWAPLEVGFDLPAGACQAKLVVRDRGSRAIGRVLHTFDVPDPGSWRVSTPILSDMPGQDRSSRPRMLVSRSYASGTPLYCYFEVYNGASGGAPPASFEYTVVDGRGKSRKSQRPTPVALDAGGTPRRLETIAQDGLTPGEYELRLTVRDELAGRAEELREAFTVRRPPRPNLAIYTELVRAFLDGEIDRAMSGVLGWRPKELEELAASLPPEDMPLRRAALLLHTALAFRLWENARAIEADAQIAIGRAVLAKDAPSDLHRDWLLTVGYYQQATSSPAKAQPFFLECTRLFPDAAEAWLGAGMSHELSAFPDGLAVAGAAPTQGAAEEAERCYREAVRIAPGLPEARLRLGRVLRVAGALDEAERELAAAVAAGGEGSLTALAHVFWGELRETRRDAEGAIEHYRSALAMDRECQTAAFALSEALHRLGRYREAADSLAPALLTGDPAGLSPWHAYHVGSGRRNVLTAVSPGPSPVADGARPYGARP